MTTTSAQLIGAISACAASVLLLRASMFACSFGIPKQKRIQKPMRTFFSAKITGSDQLAALALAFALILFTDRNMKITLKALDCDPPPHTDEVYASIFWGFWVVFFAIYLGRRVFSKRFGNC